MKRLSGFLVSLLLVTAFVPSVVLASNVNTKLAENSRAVMEEIEKMNLPDLPNEVAENMRGEVLFLPAVYAAAVLYGVPVSAILLRFSSNPGWPQTLTNITVIALWVRDHM